MEEKLSILKMLEDGKISVDEASKLLEAIEGKKEELSLAVKKDEGSAKWIRVRVTGNKEKVNINVPIALVDIAFKIAKANDKSFDMTLGQFNLDVNSIIQMIKEGAEGKIVDVETDDGQKVEVVIE